MEPDWHNEERYPRSADAAGDVQAFEQSAIPAVNVATVPQRSPLRYPGGKTWLIPHVRKWLQHGDPNAVLVEPFAGGAIVSLTAVMERLAAHAIMVELDRDVAAFWRAALTYPDKLVSRVQDFRLDRSMVEELLAASTLDVLDRGFRTLVLNRTRRGGVLAPGAALTKNGENGNGVASRWYPATLVKRIRAIAEYAGRLSFFEGDGLGVMSALAMNPACRLFVDPPTPSAASALGPASTRTTRLTTPASSRPWPTTARIS